MKPMAGYSGTPLPKKLGLTPGQKTAFVHLPAELEWLVQSEPFASIASIDRASALAADAGLDLIQAFFTGAAEMRAALPALRAAIQPAGAIWISWPKRASKVETDITEDVVRDAALAGGLVDVKVCAVTEAWSGLKLVVPVALRGTT
jgi:hypothetical protein